jgi:hypothetical protein
MISKSEMDALSFANYQKKLSYLEELKKNGPPKYSPE